MLSYERLWPVDEPHRFSTDRYLARRTSLFTTAYKKRSHHDRPVAGRSYDSAAAPNGRILHQYLIPVTVVLCRSEPVLQRLVLYCRFLVFRNYMGRESADIRSFGEITPRLCPSQPSHDRPPCLRLRRTCNKNISDLLGTRFPIIYCIMYALR
ncbi:hypothetical protein EX30DRAFT_127650 [Ascodesmis nigricans]|uniref:Uncharacterized protein n=1 Tax=Ascodesmis nigricans TaxID=341454 RepID=A0A4S2MNR9_9PEZI|nr:hypothetical protein EX30DRAFT_127650 [Ascodesmis nigricans]